MFFRSHQRPGNYETSRGIRATLTSFSKLLVVLSPLRSTLPSLPIRTSTSEHWQTSRTRTAHMSMRTSSPPAPPSLTQRIDQPRRFHPPPLLSCSLPVPSSPSFFCRPPFTDRSGKDLRLTSRHPYFALFPTTSLFPLPCSTCLILLD